MPLLLHGFNYHQLVGLRHFTLSAMAMLVVAERISARL